MTVQQVAELLGLSKKTLYNLRSQGEGPPAMLLRRRLRYRRSDVLAWVERQGRPECRSESDAASGRGVHSPAASTGMRGLSARREAAVRALADSLRHIVAGSSEEARSVAECVDALIAEHLADLRQ